MIACLETARIEEDLRLLTKPLAQGIAQIRLEAAHPAYVLGVLFVVEMRVADEKIVLKTGDERHNICRPYGASAVHLPPVKKEFVAKIKDVAGSCHVLGATALTFIVAE